MDALHNLANQEIFKMAKAADEFGERTVGVITKSDAVASGDEKDVSSSRAAIAPLLILRSSYSATTTTRPTNLDTVGSLSEICRLKKRTTKSAWSADMSWK
jgi:hypothetical protein